MQRRTFLLGTLLAGAAASPAMAAADETKLSAGFVNAVGSIYLDTLKTVPGRIKAATQGKLDIVEYASLVDGPDQPAAVRDDRLDSSFAVTPWLSADTPYLNFGSLPGLVTEEGVYHKLLDEYLRAATAKIWLSKYNAVQVMTGLFEEQCLISKVPIRKVEDFRGKKVRVISTEAAELMKKLGAAPTPVPFGEIVPALQRSIVDIVMTSVGTANGFGFYTVAKYISIWKIGTIVPWSYIVNKNAWAKLPADIRGPAQAELRKIEDEHFASLAAFDNKCIQEFIKHGMQVYEAPPSELAKVFDKQNVAAVYNNWYKLNDRAGTDGRALVKKIRELEAKIKA